MQPESFLKCPCENCGAHIEFPAEGIGQTIPCPHCGWKTKLLKSGEPAAASPIAGNSPKRARPVRWIALGSLSLVAAMAFGIFVARKNSPPDKTEQPILEATVENIAAQEASEKKRPARRPKKAAAKPEFESNGLAALRVDVEKSDNSGLVYATGTIRNKSDRQRFGVKVELDLFDAQNTKIGSTTDYAQVIEPRKEWNFRAMVTEADAASAKVTSITEQ
jgi:hypothetical protein